MLSEARSQTVVGRRVAVLIEPGHIVDVWQEVVYLTPVAVVAATVAVAVVAVALVVAVAKAQGRASELVQVLGPTESRRCEATRVFLASPVGVTGTA